MWIIYIIIFVKRILYASFIFALAANAKVPSISVFGLGGFSYGSRSLNLKKIPESDVEVPEFQKKFKSVQDPNQKKRIRGMANLGISCTFEKESFFFGFSGGYIRNFGVSDNNWDVGFCCAKAEMDENDSKYKFIASFNVGRLNEDNLEHHAQVLKDAQLPLLEAIVRLNVKNLQAFFGEQEIGTNNRTKILKRHLEVAENKLRMINDDLIYYGDWIDQKNGEKIFEPNKNTLKQEIEKLNKDLANENARVDKICKKDLARLKKKYDKFDENNKKYLKQFQNQTVMKLENTVEGFVMMNKLHNSQFYYNGSNMFYAGAFVGKNFGKFEASIGVNFVTSSTEFTFVFAQSYNYAIEGDNTIYRNEKYFTKEISKTFFGVMPTLNMQYKITPEISLTSLVGYAMFVKREAGENEPELHQDNVLLVGIGLAVKLI